MAELKTKPTDVDVIEFINKTVENGQKRTDSFELLRLMSEATGHAPKMWGTSIIGFGSYHFKSERSQQQGDWPLVGFSPRKAAISLYVFTGAPEHEHLLDGLGTFKRGAACIYVKKLKDINVAVLNRLMRATIDYLQAKYGQQDASR